MVEQRPFKALVVGSSPTQPRIFIQLESPQSRSGSHSAAGSLQSNAQFHAVVCCYLLLFFWVALAVLAFLTAVRCTSRYFITLLASSETSRRSEEGDLRR
jgi:hypothetical protein